jgi:hypothetical protein
MLPRLLTCVAKARLAVRGLRHWTVPGPRLLRRKLAWALLRGQADYVSFERDGVRWSVSTRDVVGECLFLVGRFHLECLDELLGWLRSRYTDWPNKKAVINVGANIGATCIPLTL